MLRDVVAHGRAVDETLDNRVRVASVAEISETHEGILRVQQVKLCVRDSLRCQVDVGSRTWYPGTTQR